MDTSSNFRIAGRKPSEWFSSLPIVIILLLAVFIPSHQIIHSQMQKVGQKTWPGYSDLRDTPAPECDVNADIAGQVEARYAEEMEIFANLEPGSIEAELTPEPNKDTLRRSYESRQKNCERRWQRYEDTQARLTPALKRYKSIEQSFSSLSVISSFNNLLLTLLILIGAATTTVKKHHISLRPIQTLRDHYVSTAGQLVGNSLLTYSAVAYLANEMASQKSGLVVSNIYLLWFWIAGFGLFSLINLFQLAKPGKGFREGGSWGKALLTIPLFSFMAMSAGFYFVSKNYPSGLSVQLKGLMDNTQIFLSLALYIWIGMMLKQTRLAQLVFNVLRPWQMSPELLAFVVLLVTAIPTAYTGASGIFVIAAGAVVFNELIRNGTRPQLALATTAMSGSMGVVLRPCLLVLIIAMLSKDVTSANLYSSGLKVFFFTIGLFFIYSQFARQEPARIAPFKEAFPQSIKLLLPITPYIIIIAATVLVFKHVLDTKLDELSAPIILPVVMLLILLYEYVFTSKAKRQRDKKATELDGNKRPASFEHALRTATSEATIHIGALLVLMALSVSVGGMIEDSAIMSKVPVEYFTHTWSAMAIIVVALVITGMFMDPYGAVILINATLAGVAIKAGIEPMHFWIVALISFELGYLTPPVALNHLLTRQVVGDDVVEAAKPETGNFWYRYEKYTLPIAVLLTALLVVAFGPLISEGLHTWLFQDIAR